MKTLLLFPFLTPGLNGKDGLIRQHWAKRKKKMDYYQWLIRTQSTSHHKQCVVITYTRFCTKGNFMDWDNHGASFKLWGDALKHQGIIADDSPNVIIELKLRQIAVKHNPEQRTEITIEDYL
jgi:Holliday junction resolvase RusA-like endonuclease